MGTKNRLVGTAKGVNLDELARLKEERDHLIQSLNDLDNEVAVGDVEDADFESLRAGYEVRLARVLDQLESGNTALENQGTGSTSLRKTMVSMGVVTLFAVVAGVLLSRAVGTRSEGDVITGSGPEDGTAGNCIQLSFQKPPEGISCFDAVLAKSPDNLEALTYRGWAFARTDKVSEAQAEFDKVVQLDPSYPDVYVFRAVLAKDAKDFVRAQSELDALWKLDPPPALISTMKSMSLDTTVALGVMAPDNQQCWTKLRDALQQLAELEAVAEAEAQAASYEAIADTVLAVDCGEEVLKSRPDDLDALALVGLGLGVLDEESARRGLTSLDHALDVSPTDPNALLIRSALRQKLQDYAGSNADLETLGERRASPLLDTFSRDAIRAENQRVLSQGTSTTSG